ncbi:rab11 family-interacting protein 5 isoform X2 [Mesocricetus auratus]|uniref:Rab11 family-interacting protein 5 n=1 Tax=Mesocricetus auratus TaxID=10036 RepID=A0A1U8BR16_MESAU|nr:rab11 family-interacting protein 5 isoform X2 [Mesocricetus auratus]
MALVRDTEPAAGSSRWLPTHVQVTVLRASGLRGKSSGAGSTSDAYTVIQVGREKYSTSVVEKTQGCPEWCEECSFELPPGALDGLLRAQEADGAPAPWASGPNAACELVLTTMHRSLIGVDKFLGRATVALDEVFRAGRAQHTQWYKLHSKPGKKEKERGEIQVTIQFTRNNLSASMFDLSMKDKPRSPFSKLKDKVKGKKKYELESASAILPSSALEDPELGNLGKMGKAKGFFLRNKLRKSSLTQSNTSLGSDSTLSSTSGSLVYQGPGAELLTRSPSHSSWLSTEGGRDSTQSPKLLTHKRTYSDEASQLRAAPPWALLELQGHLDGASRSSLCVNGSHVYNEEPQPPIRHRSSISGPFPPSSTLHSVPPRPSEEGPRPSDDSWGRGSRGTSSSEAVPGQEELSTQAKVLALGTSCSGEEEGALPPEGKPVQVATPMVASSEAVAEKERKPRMGLFHHHHHHHHQGLSRNELGRRGSVGEKGSPSLGASPHHSSTGEEKAKSSWFGLRESKEPTQKPSASRARLAPLASPGKALPEWDDTFNIFAAGRLQPEARSDILAPAEMGPEEDGLQDPGPGTMAVKATETQRESGGGGGNSIWLEPRVPVASGLDQPSTSVSDPGPLGSSGTGPSSRAAHLHLRASASAPDPELPASEVGMGQSPADSGASLFSSPEVLSVWERLPGSDDIPGGQDEEIPQDGSQLFEELNTVEDSWPWDVITISPTAEVASSTTMQGESDEVPPPQVQPASPAAVYPMESEGHPALQLEPEPEQGLDEGPWPGTPPPKPPRLFTPTNSQVEEEEEEDQEEEENAPGGLNSGGPGIEEDTTLSELVVGPQESKEEGVNPELEELHSLSSGTMMGELELEELVGDTGAPGSGACPPSPTSCLEGPIPRSHSSTSSTLLSQKVWGTSDTGESLETQSQELAKEGFEPLSATPQQADLWVSEEEEEEDALNPFLCQESQDPPSLPSISPPGSRESSVHSGPEELPTPPEPAFPPPPLPPWASHRHGVPGPPCPPLPVAWPLTSSSPPEEPASPLGPLELSPTGGSPTPYGEDRAAATPASPLVLLPLETRPAEEPQLSGSPHPVKPLSAAPVEASPDRKQPRTSLSTALSSGLEKLKTVTSSSIQSVVPASQLGPTVDTKRLKDSAMPDQSAKYYHLTHDELIGLLLQRERELSQRDEHVQELESYIDRLLVRIMETSPTLLQISPAPPK